MTIKTRKDIDVLREDLETKQKTFEYNIKSAIRYINSDFPESLSTVSISHALIAIAIALDKFQQDVERIQG